MTFISGWRYLNQPILQEIFHGIRLLLMATLRFNMSKYYASFFIIHDVFSISKKVYDICCNLDTLATPRYQKLLKVKFATNTVRMPG